MRWKETLLMNIYRWFFLVFSHHFVCIINDTLIVCAGVLVQHGIKVTAESTGNFKSTLQKSYRSVAFLLNNFSLARDEVNFLFFYTHVNNKFEGGGVYRKHTVHLSVCPFVCLSICLSVCLSICLSVHLSVCLSVRLSVCLSICSKVL